MAKDGTNRGGARYRSGPAKKPLADSIVDGNPGKRRLTVVEFPHAADLKGGVSLVRGFTYCFARGKLVNSDNKIGKRLAKFVFQSLGFSLALFLILFKFCSQDHGYLLARKLLGCK